MPGTVHQRFRHALLNIFEEAPANIAVLPWNRIHTWTTFWAHYPAMGFDKCRRCDLRLKDVKLHPSDEFYFQDCVNTMMNVSNPKQCQIGDRFFLSELHVATARSPSATGKEPTSSSHDAIGALRSPRLLIMTPLGHWPDRNHSMPCLISNVVMIILILTSTRWIWYIHMMRMMWNGHWIS